MIKWRRELLHYGRLRGEQAGSAALREASIDFQVSPRGGFQRELGCDGLVNFHAPSKGPRSLASPMEHRLFESIDRTGRDQSAAGGIDQCLRNAVQVGRDDRTPACGCFAQNKAKSLGADGGVNQTVDGVHP